MRLRIPALLPAARVLCRSVIVRLSQGHCHRGIALPQIIDEFSRDAIAHSYDAVDGAPP